MTDSAASNGNERLDRIEANLETVSQTLVRTASEVDVILERLDQLAGSVGVLAQSMQQFTAQAEADRAIMLQILQFLQNQYPGNGRRN